MLKFILVLLGLAFGQNNANTSSYNSNSNGQPTTQFVNPETGTDAGDGKDTGGNTGQLPPPFTQL
jgi:hypothetical protein